MPFPPDYGGVIDVFYRIKQLREKGFLIVLHCFDYKHRANDSNIRKLKEYCQEVHIYSRKKSIFFLLGKQPFIVRSRQNKQLLRNLLKNDYPILFEGIHTTSFLSHSLLKKRYKVLRTHNIEHKYYRYLSESTNQFFKRLFYKIESRKLKRYEIKILPFAQKVLSISDADKRFFEKLNPETIVLNPSLDIETVPVQPETAERFILFHGNLSVEENEKAALFLTTTVFSKIDFPVVIAGKSPSAKLQKAATSLPNVRLVASPDEKTMKSLIVTAHIHLLYSFQDTGVKLKLLSVLQNGRFCIANNAIVGDLAVGELLILANSPEEILSEIKELMNKQFDENQREHRNSFLLTVKQRTEAVLMSVFTDEQ